MFVALHELAHIGTSEIGHTQQYWKNLKFILENAVNQRIYMMQWIIKKNHKIIVG